MFFQKKSTTYSWILAGLGNPGPKYDKTRHNAGFHAIDAIAKANNASISKLKFHALTGEVTLSGERCLLLKPQTYMNNSGDAVEAARSYYKIPMERVLVFFDDISLDPGKIRIRRKGSHGGHNGIKSIIAMTGEDDFPRVKLGVGAKPHPEYDLADWVLSVFIKGEMAKMQEAYDQCESIATLIVSGKLDEAMCKFNS